MICPNCHYNDQKKMSTTQQRKGRSIPQNSSYWKLLIEPLAEYLALDKMETHFLCKHKFLQEIRNQKHRDGTIEELFITRSTTSLSTTEHNEFCSKIRMWASQMGLYLKEPNESLT